MSHILIQPKIRKWLPFPLNYYHSFDEICLLVSGPLF